MGSVTKTAVGRGITTVRGRGFRGDLTTTGLRALAEVARALFEEGSDWQRIERAFRLAIQRQWPYGGLQSEIALLWLGLDPSTQGCHARARGEAAWAHYENSFEGDRPNTRKTFDTHSWGRIREALATELMSLYREPPAPTQIEAAGEPSPVQDPVPVPVPDPVHDDAPVEAGQFASVPRLRRWVLAGCIMAVVGVAVVWLLKRERTASPSAATGMTAHALRRYPTVVKGSGTEPPNLTVPYRGRLLSFRWGIVPHDPDNGAAIQLFPVPVSCDDWPGQLPKGPRLYINAGITPTNVSDVVMDAPIPDASVAWVVDTKRGSGTGPAGDVISVILTTIDTQPGGVWRGRIVLRNALDPQMEKMPDVEGTFSAAWCEGRENTS